MSKDFNQYQPVKLKTVLKKSKYWTANLVKKARSHPINNE
jgi:hypothetical protein